MHSAKLTFLLFLILALIICNPSKAEWITKKSDISKELLKVDDMYSKGYLTISECTKMKAKLLKISNAEGMCDDVIKAEWITKKSDISKELLKVDDMYSKGYLTISECTKMKAKLLKISSATGMCDDVITVVKNESNETQSFDWMAEVRHPKTNEVFKATRLSTKDKAINLAIKKCYKYVTSSLNKIGYNDCYVSKSVNVKNNNDIIQTTKQEKFNEILKNIENSPIGDYYVFGHATTGEKFWGSTESINRSTTVGTTTSTSGRFCKITSKLKNKKMPFKGTFSLECPMEKVKGSWTQETGTSPGIGQAFTDKGDVITAFFSPSRLEVKNFAKKFLNKQRTQIAKVEEPKQEEFKPKKTNQDNEAPVIEIAEAITVDSQAYTLKGKVKDKSQVYLTIGGRQVDVKKGKFKLDRFNINPDVIEEIKIVAIDQWNNKSEKTINIKVEFKQITNVRSYEKPNPNNIRTKTDNNKIGIIIGIEKYQALKNLDAPYANRDANAFRAYATRALGIPNKNLKILIDDKATRSGLLKALKIWLPQMTRGKNKDIYIFFAGHGLASDDGKDLHILPQDGDPILLEDTALSRIEMFDLINKVSPKSVTMFFDTCYSGQTRSEQMLVAGLRPVRIVADEQDTPNNFTIFTASNYDQTSGSINEAEHGIFTYYLMKGLEGNADANKDKKLTNGELIAYLKNNVSQEAFTQNRSQEPMLAGDPDKILMSYR